MQCTEAHLKDEERIMQEHHYPGFAAHKALHDQVRQRTADLEEKMSLVTARELLGSLKSWWLGHIQSTDMEYVPYVVWDRKVS